MNSYKTIYKNLVHSRQHLKEEWKPVGSGLERHHIVPKHHGGLDEESNYTYLTHREHVIAHWLLWKIYGLAKDKYVYRRMMGRKCGWFTHSTATKEKMSVSQKLRFQNTSKEKEKERGRKISKALKGRVIGDPKVKSEAAKRRKKQAWTGKKRPIVTCPHCGKSGSDFIMPRWHFDNCRFLT